jgi:hypothetical protein
LSLSFSFFAALSAKSLANPDFFFFLAVGFGRPPTGEAERDEGVLIDGKEEGEVGGNGEVQGVGSEIEM